MSTDNSNIERELVEALSAIGNASESTLGAAHLGPPLATLNAHTHRLATGNSRWVPLHNATVFLLNDFDNLCLICYRMEWLRQFWVAGVVEDFLWIPFVKCDISLFHTEFRSIFDYIATALGTISPKPGQCPTSFRKLSEWLEQPQNARRLSEDAVTLIRESSWFYDIRKVRDKLVHTGAESMAFPIKGKIVFQTHEGQWENVVTNPLVMFNKNTVDFEIYAGINLGRLLYLLSRLAALLMSHIDRPVPNLGGRRYPIGLQQVETYIRQAL